jgi:hypothetical protein
VSGRYEITLPVDVPLFERRNVRIVFGRGGTLHIHVDGPIESPHRYADGTLCMWRSDSPRERRWVRSDGLRMLIGLIVLHLLREELWRQDGVWYGPEASHGPKLNEPDDLGEAS